MPDPHGKAACRWHFSDNALKAGSKSFLKLSDVQGPNGLEPWFQWHSLHTGQPYAKHQFFHLTDGPKCDEDKNQIYLGCQLRSEIGEGALIQDRTSNQALPFFKYFYKIDGMKSGCHHPDGILWVTLNSPGEQVDPVSILDIFPTITELSCVPPSGGSPAAVL